MEWIWSAFPKKRGETFAQSECATLADSFPKRQSTVVALVKDCAHLCKQVTAHCFVAFHHLKDFSVFSNGIVYIRGGKRPAVLPLGLMFLTPQTHLRFWGWVELLHPYILYL